jgi:hypothetical protein
VSKETYGTSGTRPVVRFFGGWGLNEDLCQSDDLVKRGYADGVPMGGDLPARPKGSDAPVFAVSALEDPGVCDRPGTPLQRIQVVKGWVEDGQTKEKVYDVAGGDHGASVNNMTCETRGSGEEKLCGVWADPDFDASQSAFYDAHILENPTCRWSQQLCVAEGVVCGEPATIGRAYEPCCSAEHVPTSQERAWTSPIWCTP